MFLVSGHRLDNRRPFAFNRQDIADSDAQPDQIGRIEPCQSAAQVLGQGLRDFELQGRFLRRVHAISSAMIIDSA